MSDLDALSGKPKTKNIGGVDITLSPLTMKDFDLAFLAGSEDDMEKAKGMKQVVEKTLQDSYPDVKDPLSKVSMQYMVDLMTFVIEVNGLATPENIEKMSKNIPLEKTEEESSTPEKG